MEQPQFTKSPQQPSKMNLFPLLYKKVMAMKPNLAKVLLYGSLLLFAPLPTVAIGENLFTDGKAFYTTGQLLEAERCFKAEISTNPNNATAHYLLANILLAQNQFTDAQKEYKLADPKGPIGQYSRTALTCTGGDSFIGGSAAQINCRDNSYSKLAPAAKIRIADLPVMKHSAKVISQEVANSEDHDQAECDAMVKDIYARAYTKILKVQEEMEDRIATRKYFVGGKRDNNLSVDVEQITQEYTAQIEEIKQQARCDANKMMNRYQKHEITSEDSALNLYKALINSQPSGNIMLNPAGTDFYVRGYQTGDIPSGDPAPILAAPPKPLSSTRTTDNSTQ